MTTDIDFDAIPEDVMEAINTGSVTTPGERVPPLEGLVLQTVTNLDTYDAQSGRFDTEDVEIAQVITSTTDESVTKSIVEHRHKVVLDIDLPAKLIPSSTPGHFHLYIDHEIPHNDYMNLLLALMKAGLIEPGYYNASLERGFTAARLPWVKKPDDRVQALVDRALADVVSGDPF